MLSKLKYATVSDIYVSNINTYDGQNSEKLLSFCGKFNFSYVPGEDRQSVFKVSGKELLKVDFQDNMKCQPNDLIFNDDMVSRFKNSGTDGLLFVMDDDKIVGVVHFIDYNTEFVYVELFKAFFRFEKSLRALMVEKGYYDADYHTFLKNKSENHSSDKQRAYYSRMYKNHVPEDSKRLIKKEKLRADFGPFQTLLLSELMDYGNCLSIWPAEVQAATNSIKDLRNWVAHYKDIGSKRGLNKDILADEDVHDLSSLDEFIEKMSMFIKAYESIID